MLSIWGTRLGGSLQEIRGKLLRNQIPCHQARINIILWEMGNLKLTQLIYCINTGDELTAITSSYCSVLYAGIPEATQLQRLIVRCLQSTQLNQILNIIPHSIRLLLALRSQKEFKITKRNANQPTTNHLPGALEENFIAPDINHLLITDTILSVDNMCLAPLK